MRKLAIVYYASTLGTWETVTRNSLNRMIDSGIYDAADEIYLIVSDIQNSNEDVINNLKNDYSKCIVERYVTDTSGEHNGIRKVEYLGKLIDSDYNILYMHSKGIMNTYKTVSSSDEPYFIKINGVKSWIDSMQYYLVDQWKSCVSLLNEGYDTVGVRNVYHWWWGNFWWTCSSHVKKLNPYFGGSRWECEAWLHNYHPNKDEIKYYEWFKYQYNPYYSSVPKRLWDLSSKENLKININKVEMGCFGEQQDEGRPVPTEVVVKDITESAIKHFDGRKLEVWSLYNECGNICSDSQSVRIYGNIDGEADSDFIVTSFTGTFQHIIFVNEQLN